MALSLSALIAALFFFLCAQIALAFPTPTKDQTNFFWASSGKSVASSSRDIIDADEFLVGQGSSPGSSPPGYHHGESSHSNPMTSKAYYDYTSPSPSNTHQRVNSAEWGRLPTWKPLFTEGSAGQSSTQEGVYNPTSIRSNVPLSMERLQILEATQGRKHDVGSASSRLRDVSILQQATRQQNQTPAEKYRLRLLLESKLRKSAFKRPTQASSSSSIVNRNSQVNSSHGQRPQQIDGLPIRTSSRRGTVTTNESGTKTFHGETSASQEAHEQKPTPPFMSSEWLAMNPGSREKEVKLKMKKKKGPKPPRN